MVDGPLPTEAVIEALLSDAFGGHVAIERSEHLVPWAVMRCYPDPAAPGAPSSVIVKWLRTHPMGFRTDPEQVLTERVALEFLTELALHNNSGLHENSEDCTTTRNVGCPPCRDQDRSP